jgi:hypothetical protein
MEEVGIDEKLRSAKGEHFRAVSNAFQDCPPYVESNRELLGFREPLLVVTKCLSNLENRNEKRGQVKQNLIGLESRGDVTVRQFTAASLCPFKR